MSIFFSKQNKGFTLVEILAVCAVIAILATVVYGTLGEARKKARDDERRAELQQIELALRLYKDQYGRYPERGCSSGPWSWYWTSPGPGNQGYYVSCDEFITGLVPTFFTELPTDPDETKINSGYMYLTDALGTDYKVLAHDTVEGGVVNPGEEKARCPASCSNAHCTQSSYAVYSSGAACW